MRKLLQNTLFAAMTAWALHGVHAHLDQAHSAQAPVAAVLALTP